MKSNIKKAVIPIPVTTPDILPNICCKLNDQHILNNNSNLNYPNLITSYNSNEKVKIISSDFEDKLKEFKTNNKKLMIVSDFDFTLTKKHSNGIRLFSSYCVMENSKFMSEEFKRLNKEMFDKYSIYENDISMVFEERDNLVRQWFKENLDLVLSENLSKDDFKHMILEAELNFYYRYGIIELFHLIYTNKIPFYIISGGMHEIIEESLKLILPYYDELKSKNLIHIIANKFIYDKNEKVSGYQEPFVYTFNKGETLKRIFKEFNTGEEYIIVMGDHLNDTDTIKHIDYSDEIKIGFINYDEDCLSEQHHKMIEAYHLKYDICVVNDGNLTFVNNLIKKIVE